MMEEGGIVEVADKVCLVSLALFSFPADMSIPGFVIGHHRLHGIPSPSALFTFYTPYVFHS
jgi:hypothetical protein